MAATGNRVLVHVRKCAGKSAVPAKFSECLLSAVSPGVREEADCVSVCCELKDQKFILWEASLGRETKINWRYTFHNLPEKSLISSQDPL